MQLLKRLPEFVFYLALGVGLCVASLWNQTARERQQEDIQNKTGYPPAVTQKSPSFTVTAAGQDALILSSSLWESGQTLVIFSFPDCPYVADLLDACQGAGFPTKKVAVVFVDARKGDEAIAEQYAESYPGYAFYTESAHSAAWAYNVTSSPRLYIYDETGTIVYRRIGAFSPDSDKDAIAQGWLSHLG